MTMLLRARWLAPLCAAAALGCASAGQSNSSIVPPWFRLENPATPTVPGIYGERAAAEPRSSRSSAHTGGIQLVNYETETSGADDSDGAILLPLPASSYSAPPRRDYAMRQAGLEISEAEVTDQESGPTVTFPDLPAPSLDRDDAPTPPSRGQFENAGHHHQRKQVITPSPAAQGYPYQPGNQQGYQAGAVSVVPEADYPVLAAAPGDTGPKATLDPARVQRWMARKENQLARTGGLPPRYRNQQVPALGTPIGYDDPATAGGHGAKKAYRQGMVDAGIVKTGPNKRFQDMGYNNPCFPRELRMRSHPLYVVEPPDVLYIEALQLLPNRPIAGERLIRQDGTISLGYYGQIHVAGLTLAEVEGKIRDRLSEYVNDPQVYVDVAAFNSKVYYVLGQVQQTGRLPVTGKETVLDAVTLAGGVTNYAWLKRMHVARPNPGGGCDQMLAVDWKAITEFGDTRTNYQLLPGDRVVVPSTPGYKTTVFFDNNLTGWERLANLLALLRFASN